MVYSSVSQGGGLGSTLDRKRVSAVRQGVETVLGGGCWPGPVARSNRLVLVGAAVGSQCESSGSRMAGPGRSAPGGSATWTEGMQYVYWIAQRTVTVRGRGWSGRAHRRSVPCGRGRRRCGGCQWALGGRSGLQRGRCGAASLGGALSSRPSYRPSCAAEMLGFPARGQLHLAWWRSIEPSEGAPRCSEEHRADRRGTAMIGRGPR